MQPNVPDDFTPIQVVCADYIENVIRNVSKEHYACNFMEELDYWLYAETVNQKSIHLEEYVLKNLQICSESIGGWVIWNNDIHEPQYMKTVEVIRQIELIKEKRKKT
jgi:hypothetical protein